MIDRRNILIFDFESSSANKNTCEILSIGSCIINCNNFDIMDSFESLMKPEDFDALEDEALAVNGLTKEQLQEAPEAKVTFNTWATWIKKFNTDKKQGTWGAPIPCGYNISGFDLPILNRYCKKYGYWDDKWNNNTLVNPIFNLDIMQLMWLFTRTNRNLKNNKLTTVLAYMGVSQNEIDENAHNALWDVQQTAKIAIKFLKAAKNWTSYDKERGRSLLEIKGSLNE